MVFSNSCLGDIVKKFSKLILTGLMATVLASGGTANAGRGSKLKASAYTIGSVVLNVGALHSLLKLICNLCRAVDCVSCTKIDDGCRIEVPTQNLGDYVVNSAFYFALATGLYCGVYKLAEAAVYELDEAKESHERSKLK